MANKRFDSLGAAKRNELFELINRLPDMLDLVEKAQEAIYELEIKFMIDDEQRHVDKINKHLDWLGEYYIQKQKEVAIKYKELA